LNQSKKTRAVRDYARVNLRKFCAFSTFLDKKKEELFGEFQRGCEEGEEGETDEEGEEGGGGGGAALTVDETCETDGGEEEGGGGGGVALTVDETCETDGGEEEEDGAATKPPMGLLRSLNKLQRKQEEINALRKQIEKINIDIDARVELQLQGRKEMVCVELGEKHDDELTRFAQIHAKAQEAMVNKHNKERTQLHVMTQTATDDAARLRKKVKTLTQNRDELAEKLRTITKGGKNGADTHVFDTRLAAVDTRLAAVKKNFRDKQASFNEVREHQEAKIKALTQSAKKDAVKVKRVQSQLVIEKANARAAIQKADNLATTVRSLNNKLHMRTAASASDEGEDSTHDNCCDHSHSHRGGGGGAAVNSNEEEEEEEDEGGEEGSGCDEQDYYSIDEASMCTIIRVLKTVTGIPNSFAMSLPVTGWSMLAGNVETTDRQLQLVLNKLNERMSTLCSIAGIGDEEETEGAGRIDWDKMIEVGFKTIEFSDQSIFHTWKKIYADFAAFAHRLDIEGETTGVCKQSLPMAMKVTTLLAAVETRIPALLEKAAIKFDEVTTAAAKAAEAGCVAAQLTTKLKVDADDALELVEQSKLMLTESDAILVHVKHMLSEGNVAEAMKLISETIDSPR
jgi:hypothetical protein